MPTPSKTTNADIVAAARALIESHGPEFSMAELASAVGIRAPSLYKRFADRAAILSAVEEQVIHDLTAHLAKALRRTVPSPLKAAARAYRSFALKNPNAYMLMFTATASDDDAVQAARHASVAPIIDAITAANPDINALSAARFLTAFLHGFVSMEIAGAFRLGGSVSRAFDEGVELAIHRLEA